MTTIQLDSSSHDTSSPLFDDVPSERPASPLSSASSEAHLHPDQDVEMTLFSASASQLPSASPSSKLDILPDDSPALRQYKTLCKEREARRSRHYDHPDPDSCFHSSAPMPWFTKYRESLAAWRALLSPSHPLWIFLALTLLPPAFVALIYGGIPVYDPYTTDFDQRLTYLLLLVPLTFLMYTAFIVVLWLAILEVRSSAWALAKYFVVPLLCTGLLPTVTMLLILPFTEPFPAIGMIPYGVAVGAFLLTLFVRRIYSSCQCSFYATKRTTMIKLLILSEFTFCLFVAYTLVYRQIPGSYQKLMTAVWVFCLLFIKKAGLTFTDEAPYELAMLCAGFTIQSMSDTFFTFVYPNIQDPKSTYLVIFFVISGTDYLYLLFLTHRWMRFRVWIKGRLKAFFCCRPFQPELHQPIWVDVYEDDRGQTDMKAGYFRRQIQFFYYRTLSGFFAQVFFLIATPIFRYWTNQAYFPFHNEADEFGDQFEPLAESAYRNACIYSLARLGTLLVLLPLSYWVINRWLAPEELQQMMARYRHLLTSKRFISYIVVSLLSGQLLCAWMALLHNQIWFIETD